MQTSRTERPNLSRVMTDLLSGERPALAKAISAVESGTDSGKSILRSIRSNAREQIDACLVVGMTGPPGCGKSTLTAGLVAELRKRDMRIGIVAVDPSSPVSGGALLGDRLRMAQHASDPGVFVRSLSSRGRLGGLAPAARDIVDLMAASGMTAVIVETVGAGQTEVEIASLAKIKVVVGAPGLGDDIQAIKSGILEIADIFVVNKGDLPGAAQTASQLRAMQSLRPKAQKKTPVLVTSAIGGEGLSDLADTIIDLGEDAKGQASAPLASGAVRQALIAEVLRKVTAKLEKESELLDINYCQKIINGATTIEVAAQEITDRLANDLGKRDTG